MAENSLFAILLRSRWWVSVLVGAVWALLAAALVPAPYKLIGVLGALPFWALALVAFMRQLGQPSPGQQQALLEAAAAQPWAAFAGQLERAWQVEGYAVERANDPRYDFVLHRAGKTTLVLARRWKAATHGAEPLRQLLQATQQQHADTCAYVCIGTVSATAQSLADQHQIAILNGATLAGLLKKSGA